MVFVNCTGILLPHSIEPQNGNFFFHIYDANTGMFVFKVKVKENVYLSQQQQLCNNYPRHVVVNSLLKDVPVMRDFLGFVSEAGQIIEFLHLTILTIIISVPITHSYECIITLGENYLFKSTPKVKTAFTFLILVV